MTEIRELLEVNGVGMAWGFLIPFGFILTWKNSISIFSLPIMINVLYKLLNYNKMFQTVSGFAANKNK